MTRIPESFSDVSPEWLTAALRSTGHLGQETVVAGDTQSIGRESGFASQVSRIRLTFDPPSPCLPTSIVVKMASASSDQVRSQMLEDSYARECAFYSLIWPDVGVRTPVCYYAAHEAEPPRFVLLLEDLAAARFGDAATGWSRDDAMRVVDALAALHATWWNDPRLGRWNWLLPFGDATAQLKKLAGRRATFVERHRQDVSPDLQRLTMRVGARQAELIRRLGGSPCTLLHVDTHLDNIAFNEAGTPILFDWQGVGRGLGVVDLAVFLSGGSVERRRMYERELIERYHGRLTAAGVTGYSLETLMADYVVALLRWWIGTVNGLGSSRAGAWAGRQAELARQSVHRWNAIAADHALSDLVEPG